MKLKIEFEQLEDSELHVFTLLQLTAQ